MSSDLWGRAFRGQNRPKKTPTQSQQDFRALEVFPRNSLPSPDSRPICSLYGFIWFPRLGGITAAKDFLPEKCSPGEDKANPRQRACCRNCPHLTLCPLGMGFPGKSQEARAASRGNGETRWNNSHRDKYSEQKMKTVCPQFSCAEIPRNPLGRAGLRSNVWVQTQKVKSPGRNLRCKEG